LVRKCLQPGRRVIPGKHFRDELENEGLTLSDALHVLGTGRIYGEPEQDIKTGDWKYRIEGKEVDGRALKIVFCFKDYDGIDAAYLIIVFVSR
jgi:hypothetical protein